MKKIPEFNSESEERLFWEKNDSSDYLDWNQAKLAIFPNLKPTTKAISLRLPESMLAQIKVEANKRDIPYQSLMKIYQWAKCKRRIFFSSWRSITQRSAYFWIIYIDISAQLLASSISSIEGIA